MLQYLKKYWFFAILAPLFMLGEVSMDLLQPRLMSIIVDEGVLGLSNNNVGNLRLVITTGLQMIGLVSLGCIQLPVGLNDLIIDGNHRSLVLHRQEALRYRHSG